VKVRKLRLYAEKKEGRKNLITNRSWIKRFVSCTRSKLYAENYATVRVSSLKLFMTPVFQV
jgi:hypothetical protein